MAPQAPRSFDHRPHAVMQRCPSPYQRQKNARQCSHQAYRAAARGCGGNGPSHCGVEGADGPLDRRGGRFGAAPVGAVPVICGPPRFAGGAPAHPGGVGTLRFRYRFRDFRRRRHPQTQQANAKRSRAPRPEATPMTTFRFWLIQERISLTGFEPRHCPCSNRVSDDMEYRLCNVHFHTGHHYRTKSRRGSFVASNNTRPIQMRGSHTIIGNYWHRTRRCRYWA